MIKSAIMSLNPCYVDNQKIIVKGLMLHSVGTPQPSAEVWVKKWNNPSYDRACVHAFIDGNTGDVFQTLPWDTRGWHGSRGSNGSVNDTHIGVEMCEPGCIKYTSGSKFTVEDKAEAVESVKKTYAAAAELFAILCKQYNLNPLEKGVIISHSEGYKLGISSNHADPEHLWKGVGLDYTMDTFRQAVYDKLSELNVLYKVQVGAFREKENAEKQLAELKKAGFDGIIVETGKATEVGKATEEVKPTKSAEEVAKEIIAGKGNWGTGATRKQRLTDAGYDAAEVQKIINSILL